MAQLWTKMTQFYGHKFTSSFGDHDVDGVWLRALNGLTPKDLANGLAACSDRPDPWPPSAPEFKHLCIASLSGFPDAETAYREACNSAGMAEAFKCYSHPVVRVAAKNVGSARLRSEEKRFVYPEFQRAYEIVCRRALAGEDMEAEIPVALETPDQQERRHSGTTHSRGSSQGNKATAAATLANLRNLLA